MKTIGQAIDEAIAAHEKMYSQSKVNAVQASESDDSYMVSLDADHFSQRLTYSVEKNNDI